MRRARRAGSGPGAFPPAENDAQAEARRGGGAWRGPARLLCGAAVLHVALSVALYELGRRAAAPGAVDTSGVVVAVAPDAAVFREDAAGLSGALSAGEFSYWFGADYPFHVKLYSTCFAVFGPWLGYNVVGAEPLNALLYLASLAAVFGIGNEVFGRRAGLLAAGAVALWPSFLLHSTQFLKDPVYVSCFLALVLILVRLLTRADSWARALSMWAAGVIVLTALWLTRSDMGVLLVATVLLAALMIAARQIAERRARPANLVCAALLLVAAVGVPVIVPDALELGSLHDPARAGSASPPARRPAADEAAPAAAEESAQRNILSRAAARVGKVRRRFAEMYPDSGSNIDADVRIDDAADVLGHLPRAAAVGFFAPFPNMWLGSGKRVGSTGRRLAGLESLAMYAVEALAIVGLWRGRRRLGAWLLSAVAAVGMTALGLVVVNVGALYRLRYVFVVLLIVVAAGAAASVLGRRPRGSRGGGERGEAG